MIRAQASENPIYFAKIFVKWLATPCYEGFLHKK
jgi:hypothetical protein